MSCKDIYICRCNQSQIYGKKTHARWMLLSAPKSHWIQYSVVDPGKWGQGRTARISVKQLQDDIGLKEHNKPSLMSSRNQWRFQKDLRPRYVRRGQFCRIVAKQTSVLLSLYFIYTLLLFEFQSIDRDANSPKYLHRWRASFSVSTVNKALSTSSHMTRLQKPSFKLQSV